MGNAPYRDGKKHAAKLRSELDEAVVAQQRRRRPEIIQPALILRVQMEGQPLEEDWERLGLTIVSADADRTLIVFSTNDELDSFKRRVTEFEGGTKPGKKNPPYHDFITSIESIGQVEPNDRIGSRYKSRGFLKIEDFTDEAEHVVDIELWDFDNRALRDLKATQIGGLIEHCKDEVYDTYVGPSITIIRARLKGSTLRSLLSIEEIASIDLTPEPDVIADDALERDMGSVGELNTLSQDAPIIGIIDSGLNAHPLLEDVIAGSIGVPERLGTADEWGHGTRVGSIAVFGDLRAQLSAGTLNRGSRLCSARVVNSEGRFDDRSSVPAQMREAISTLHLGYGCRIFVIALADVTSPHKGGKVGSWAATLDELARELDVLIVVSSGNRTPRSGAVIEQAVTHYPQYLLEESNRIFEPAGAINVLTVGALAHGSGIDQRSLDYAAIQPITEALDPSPFSRTGPGVGSAIKPDLVEIGRTIVFDATLVSLRSGIDLPSAGVITLHHLYLKRLFTTASGTSYAAPRIAFSAAQLLTRLPEASANLLRALLINSASIPAAALERLASLGDEAQTLVCGHGQPDLERAAYSDDARVVLYAEDSLLLDHFAVYSVPVPRLFQSTAGARKISVTLAYDPPVRHTRNDYAGIGMSFRLIRGCPSDIVFEHFRKRSKDEDRFPEIASKFTCALEPTPTIREKNNVQHASIEDHRGIEAYGDEYFLVVRCESGWAKNIEAQSFAIVVEIAHKANVRLYERISQRVRVQT